MRGFGRSGRPPEVADYALANAVGDVAGILDTLGIEAAHVVGHDWGAAVAWLRRVRPGAVTLRGDRGREPLDPAGRTGPA